MSRTRIAVPAAVLAALLAALVLAAPAGAAPKLLTFKAGPYPVSAYSVRLGNDWGTIPTPGRDGWITRMEADVVDVKTGKVVPINRIMLHHIVFWNLGPDLKQRQAFYGDGEERAKMILPPGYGYRVEKGDRWGFVWMLMNHRWRADSVYIRYRVWFDTAPKKEVIPMAWDTSHGRQGLVFDVPGTGGPGAQDVRISQYRASVAGRLVAGLGHVHGGATDLSLGRPECADDRALDLPLAPDLGAALERLLPGAPGAARARPDQHEPVQLGGRRADREGRARPRDLALRRHPAAHPGDGAHARLPSSGPERDEALRRPSRRLPRAQDLHGRPLAGAEGGRAPLRVRQHRAGEACRGAAVGVDAARRQAPSSRSSTTASARGTCPCRGAPPCAGASTGAERHNVTVANGPEGFSSDRLTAGATFEKTFTRPGTYSFFCELHPVGMIQRIVVRPG